MNILRRLTIWVTFLLVLKGAALAEADEPHEWTFHLSSGLASDTGALFKNLPQEGLRLRGGAQVEGKHLSQGPYSLGSFIRYGDDGQRLYPSFGIEQFQVEEAYVMREGEYLDILAGRRRLFRQIPGGILDGGKVSLREFPSFLHGPRWPLDVSLGAGRAASVGNKLGYQILGAELSLPYSRFVQTRSAVWTQAYAESEERLTFGTGGMTLSLWPEHFRAEGDVIWRGDSPGPVRKALTLRGQGPFKIESVLAMVREKPRLRPLTNEFQYLYTPYQEDSLKIRTKLQTVSVDLGLQGKRVDAVIVEGIQEPVDLEIGTVILGLHWKVGLLSLNAESGSHRYDLRSIGSLTRDAILGPQPISEQSLGLKLKTPFGDVSIQENRYLDGQGRVSTRTTFGGIGNSFR